MSIIYAADRFAARKAEAQPDQTGRVIHAADRFTFRAPVTDPESLRALKVTAAVNKLIGL